MAGMTNFRPKIEIIFFRFDTLNFKSIRQTKVISWLLAYIDFISYLCTWKKES